MGRLTAVLLVSCALTSLLPALASASSGTVGYTFEKRRIDARDAPHLTRRQSKTVSVGITNELILYFINVTVRTPRLVCSLW